MIAEENIVGWSRRRIGGPDDHSAIIGYAKWPLATQRVESEIHPPSRARIFQTTIRDWKNPIAEMVQIAGERLSLDP